jgi:hypothetical protein
MTEDVEYLTVGELMRIAKVHLFYLQNDRERLRRYYQQNGEARRKANLERYHRNKKRVGTETMMKRMVQAQMKRRCD